MLGPAAALADMMSCSCAAGVHPQALVPGDTACAELRQKALGNTGGAGGGAGGGGAGVADGRM